MGGPEGTGRPRPGRGTEVLGGAYDDPRLGQISQPDPHVTVGCAPVIDADELPTADHAPADVPFGSEAELNPQPIPPGKAAIRSSGVDDAAIIIVGGNLRPGASEASPPPP